MFAYTNWLRRKKHDKIWCTTYIILYIYICWFLFHLPEPFWRLSRIQGEFQWVQPGYRATRTFCATEEWAEGHPPNEVRGWGRAEKHPLCCLVMLEVPHGIPISTCFAWYKKDMLLISYVVALFRSPSEAHHQWPHWLMNRISENATKRLWPKTMIPCFMWVKQGKTFTTQSTGNGKFIAPMYLWWWLGDGAFMALF